MDSTCLASTPSSSFPGQVSAAANRLLLEFLPKWKKTWPSSNQREGRGGRPGGPSDDQGTRSLVVELDLVKLSQVEPELFETLWLSGPDGARELFADVLTIKDDECGDQESAERTERPARRTVEVSISALPHCLAGVDLGRDWRRPCRQWGGGVDQDDERQTLRHLQAVLTSCVGRVQYVKSSRFFCPDGCTNTSPMVQGFQVRLPGDKVDSLCLRRPSCGSCGGPTEEDVRERDEAFCTLAVFAVVSENADQTRMRGFQVLVMAEHSSCLIPGLEYDLVLKDLSVNSSAVAPSLFPFFECLNICRSDAKVLSLRDVGPGLLMPRQIQEILSRSRFHPWLIVESLSELIASDVIPEGAFVAFRKGLLLSLVSSQDSPLHLLVSTRCDPELARLAFQSAARLHPGGRWLWHRPAAAMSAEEAAVRACGGVLLCVDHEGGDGGGGKVSKTTREVFSMLSSADRNTKRFTGCSVWLLLDPTGAKKPRRIKGRNAVDNSLRLAETFGTAFSCYLENDAEDSRSARHFVQGQQNGWQRTAMPPHSDFRLFLSQIRTRKLPVEPDASGLLKRYFVASRRVRHGETEVSRATLTALTILAESHAKLSLHPSVRLSDSLAAVFIVEGNLFRLTGYSFLDDTGEIFRENCALEVCEKMLCFHGKLVTFCASYSGDVTFEE